MGLLGRMLRSREPQLQVAALEAAAALTREPAACTALAAVGGAPALCNLVVEQEPQLARLAAVCLQACCRSDDGVVRRVQAAQGLFAALVERLTADSDAEAVAAVADLLRVLCQSGRGRDTALAGECTRALTELGVTEALLAALESESLAVQRSVAFALFVLARLDANKITIGERGGVPRLVCGQRCPREAA